MKKPLLVFIAGFASGALLVSALVGVYIFRTFPQTRDEAARMMTGIYMQDLAEACHTHRRMVGTWPSTLGEIRHERGKPFLDIFPKYRNDGWGHPFTYTPFDVTKGFGSFTSYGADGRPSGTDSAADIELRFTDYGTAKPWPPQ